MRQNTLDSLSFAIYIPHSDWDDDGTIEPEKKAKRNLLKRTVSVDSKADYGTGRQNYYKTGE